MKTIGEDRLELCLPLRAGRSPLSGQSHIMDADDHPVQDMVAGCYSAIIYRVNTFDVLVEQVEQLEAALGEIIDQLDRSGDDGFDYSDISFFYRWYRRNENRFREVQAGMTK